MKLERSERTDYVLGAEVIAWCNKKPYKIEEITQKIYGNTQAKNIIRVYQCIDVLLQHGIIVPKFNNRLLKFSVDEPKDVKRND